MGLNLILMLIYLVFLSIFVDVVDIGVMGVVMVEDMLMYFKNSFVLEVFGSFNMFFYGLGVVVYVFEGIGMVLLLEVEIKDKNLFGKVLGFFVVVIFLMFGLFGVLGYFVFGEEMKDMIIMNFG